MNEQYPWPQSAYNQIGEKDKENNITIQHHKYNNKDMMGTMGTSVLTLILVSVKPSCGRGDG